MYLHTRVAAGVSSPARLGVRKVRPMPIYSDRDLPGSRPAAGAVAAAS